MEKVIQRKHDSVQKANLFQKRLVWDCMYKEEFIKVMLLLSEPHELDRAKQIEKEIFKVFMEFDADKSGSIDAVELGQAMEKMGTPKSQQEIQDLIMQVDQEGTGEINFVAFAELFGIKAQQIDYAEAGRAEQLNQTKTFLGPLPTSSFRSRWTVRDFANPDADVLEIRLSSMKCSGHSGCSKLWRPVALHLFSGSGVLCQKLRSAGWKVESVE